MNLEKLPKIEGNYVEEPDMSYMDYDRINLADLEDMEEYAGRPLLLPIEKRIKFDENDPDTYRTRLLLINDELEEYLQIPINLKGNENVQTNIHNASQLYALVGGIANLVEENWTQTFNRIESVNLEEWRDFINDKEKMRIMVVEKQSRNFNYNSFRVLGVESMPTSLYPSKKDVKQINLKHFELILQCSIIWWLIFGLILYVLYF